ncbi:DEAD/DEAH box helicase family protein [Treponema denticola]|uniref:DEAD/DEAH box helicase family protein n=1 Tax=Treponema denticola TaxID=158 RepID=UPI0020A2504D|nr:DEAD/DEAH box helicase family protein [Treponema denticola]UTC87949.1 DEAD/DEAH box helicase family protein [Treponema denticola]
MLFKDLKSLAYEYEISKIEPKDYSYITENLKYPFYEWQKEAFELFLLNERIRDAKLIKNESIPPLHLMFNMATGSGKTLLMAALILYYYKKGYRCFVFFVNQNAILGKTQDNFINQNHSKYLFKENIVIDGKRIHLREVEIFGKSSDDIQIKFTTIQKLHNDIYKESENALLLSDLQKRDLVLLGDEAHHLNADAKKQKEQTDFEDISFIGEISGNSFTKKFNEKIEKSWENTICHYIFNKGVKNSLHNNVLLEFTATIPDIDSIHKKYDDKIIFRFDLKDFVQNGYTKHIRLVRSNLGYKERILQALLLNWYRYRIAAEAGIPNFKPIILFRSKEINDSRKDYADFIKLCKNLTERDFLFINKLNKNNLDNADDTSSDIHILNNSIFDRITAYMRDKKISFSDVVLYIKETFSERNIIITNSKDGKNEKTSPEKDKLLNSLEDFDNHIRAIFTVNRLTEGWDVLNLYDIVRLYEGRDTNTKNKKAGAATTSEVQLIGRGVRYYPFIYKDKEKNKRKFDNDLQNKLRILEEFYFHSNEDHRYINELSNELKNQGLIYENRTAKTIGIKSSLQKKLNDMYIFINERIENPKRKLKKLPQDFKNFPPFEYKIITGLYSEVRFVNFDKNDDDYIAADTGKFQTKRISICDMDLHILQKAIHRLNNHPESYYSFENLRKRFDIKGMNSFFEFLKDVKIELSYDTEFEDIPNKNLVDFCEKFFLYIQKELETYDKPYNGSDFKLVKFSDVFSFTEESGKTCLTKEKLILIDESKYDTVENRMLEKEICSSACNWYLMTDFWGTAEERNLIRYIEDHIKNLSENYDAIQLLRNEQVYKIFSFDNGEGFQPDFLLFLHGKTEKKNTCYQVFIEPKGSHLIEADKWKEDFLIQITERYGIEPISFIKNDPYVLIGLPFFNGTDSELKEKFNREFTRVIG